MDGYHEGKTPAVVAIVGSLVLVTGVGFTWILRAVVGNSVDMMTGIAISQVRMWAIASILVALVVYWERRPLASIGFQRPTVKTVGLGVGGFVATLVIFALLDPLISALGFGTTQEGVETLGQLPVWMIALVAVTAGVTEEIIFRGFLLERIEEATGALWVGAILSAAMFTLLHLPQWGGGGTLFIGVWTAIVTVFYVMTRDLGATVILHTLNDLFNFIIFPML